MLAFRHRVSREDRIHTDAVGGVLVRLQSREATDPCTKCSGDGKEVIGFAGNDGGEMDNTPPLFALHCWHDEPC